MNDPASNPHGDGRYIPGIDGWRAIAIVLVVIFHGLHNTDVQGSALLGMLAAQSARAGALGVLLFFSISGYLITSRLYAVSSGGRISLGDFLARRAFRILPPLAVYLGILLLLALTGCIQLQHNDLFAALFLANYFPGSWFTNHIWSLSVEEHYYLFWPLCILLAGWRRVMWLGLAIMVAAGTWRAWHLAHFGMAATDPAYQAARGLFLSHTESRIDFIMAGSLLALLIVFYPRTLRVLHGCGSGIGQVVLVLLLAGSVAVTRVDLRSLQAVIFALLVVGTALTGSWFSKHVLANPALLFLGKLSYSFYLWQQLFLAPTHSAWLRSPAMLPAKYVAALLAAMVSFHFIERPMIRLGRRFIQHREAQFPSLQA